MKKTNDEPIKDILKQFVNDYKHKPKMNKAKIVGMWEEIMGKTIAGYTRELQVHQGKLYIYIDSSSLRQELSFSKEKIKQLVNEELKEEFIREVIIR